MLGMKRSRVVPDVEKKGISGRRWGVRYSEVLPEKVKKRITRRI